LESTFIPDRTKGKGQSGGGTQPHEKEETPPAGKKR